jgi:Endonuclease/Exonuclease/phosphatase family
MKRLLLAVLVALVLAPVAQAERAPTVRFATFNASLNRSTQGLLVQHLSNPDVDDVYRRQIRNVAEVIQRVRPDVLLINEFDYAPPAVGLFRQNFLQVSQNGSQPIYYPYAYVAPSNTGVPSGFDLNNDGTIGGPNDAFGFGFFPGQFGMVVYSKYPINLGAVRTFQYFLWKDMPGALLPDDPGTPAPEDWYSPEELDVFRLSSKSHWDVPIQVGGKTIHFLVSHPTPPVFDDPVVDWNGKRNHDEIRFWADYISPGLRSAYIYDDAGDFGGLHPGQQFVIAGDQNSDPLDGDSIPGSAQQLLDHPFVNSSHTPESLGGPTEAVLQGGANTTHRSDPRFDTADFADIPGPGNLRADYVLPRKSLHIVDAAVFWPRRTDEFFRLTGLFDNAEWGPVGGFPTSDHRLAWTEVRVGNGN